MGKAAETRQMILQRAFELIYTKGYQANSIEDILAKTELTKGAFFYHFRTKDEMGLAIIEELLTPTMEELYIKPFLETTDPLKTIYAMMKELLMDNPFLQVQYGCPAGNLTQEMAPWHEIFNRALNELISRQQDAMQKSLLAARKNGLIRKEVNPAQVALFVMSGYWGLRNFGKLYNSKDCYRVYLKELKAYLDTLK